MAKKKIIGYVQAPAILSDKKETKHQRPYTPKEGYTGRLQLSVNKDFTVKLKGE
jgi:hypothetical protein